MSNWYIQVEEGVRDLVRYLRNQGINTTCSCHHDWYIQVDCEPEDLRHIWSLLAEYGLRQSEWRLVYRWEEVRRYLTIHLDVQRERMMALTERVK